MENKRKCHTCNIEKSLNEFYNSKRDKIFGKHRKCKSCMKEYHNNNKNQINEKQRINYDLQKAKERVYAWRIKNLGDKAKEREERNRIKNEIKEQKKQIAYYKKTVIIPLKKTIRTRLWHVFKSKKFCKYLKSEDIIGCDYNFLVKHIECQFIKDMNWNNKEFWQIDHIIPLHSAKTKEDLIKLCHYSNLQPLWAEENYKKRGKIPILTNINFTNLKTREQ